MHDKIIQYTSKQYRPISIQDIPLLQFESEMSLKAYGRQAISNQCWLETASLPVETPSLWGQYHEQIPCLDCYETFAEIAISITFYHHVRQGEQEPQSLLIMKAQMREPLLFGRLLMKEKTFVMGREKLSHQDKIETFLLARSTAFNWLCCIRTHLQHVFQLSTEEEVQLYRTILFLEQVEESIGDSIGPKQYALLCRWVERSLDMNGQVIPRTEKANRVLRILRVKGMINGFKGAHHTVEYIHNRLSCQRKGGQVYITIPEML